MHRSKHHRQPTIPRTCVSSFAGIRLVGAYFGRSGKCRGGYELYRATTLGFCASSICRRWSRKAWLDLVLYNSRFSTSLTTGISA
jgi:hypothetical protein